MQELRRSSSKSIATNSLLEHLPRLLKETQSLFNPENLSNATVSDFLRRSLRTYTGASWVEVFFCEDTKLNLYKTLQVTKSVGMNKESLPGHTAETQETQSINNASASSFYNSFSTKFNPYILPDREVVPTSSVACVPILKDGKTRLVILLFNKLDESQSLSYFTENDFLIIEALGSWAVTSIDIFLYCSGLRKKLNSLAEQHEETKKLVNIGIATIQRRSALEKCLKVLNEEQKLTKNSIQQISKVMQCQGVLVHQVANEEVKPVIAWGMENMESKALMTKTAEFTVFSSKDRLNVEDLAIEPLWEDSKSKMKCLLSCPVFNREEQPVACIEFFRKSSTFTPTDEKFASKLLEVISDFASETFSHNEKGLVDKSYGVLYKELNSFSINSEEMFDFTSLFTQVRNSLRNLLIINSCNVYMTDQRDLTFWTRQSDNCDSLSQPIEKDLLFGYAYFKQETVEVPNNLPVKDLEGYERFGIVHPILSSFTISPVIGLITVFRTSKEFTTEEKEILSKIGETVARLFESLWLNKAEQDLPQTTSLDSPDVSPEQRFRKANSRRPTNSIHYLQADSDHIMRVSSQPNKDKLSNIFSLSGISNSKFNELKALITEIRAKPDDSLRILAKRLRSLVPSQSAKLMVMDNHEQHLVDVMNSKRAKPSGLINICMNSQDNICIRTAAYTNPNFDKHLDSLGGDSQVQSFLAVPIIVQERSLGVIAFANASINFGPEDLAVAEFISLIPNEFLVNSNESIKDLNNAIQANRRHKMLQQWCKQVFFVSNSTQNKIALVRDILHKLYEEKSFNKLIKAGLEMLCAVINSEQASVIREEDSEFNEYLFKKRKLIKRTHLEDEGVIMKALESTRPISLESMYGKENIIYVPYIEKNLPKVLIKAINKRDDSLSFYCSFNKEDEQTLIEFAQAMSHAFLNEGTEKLKSVIKQHASSLNTHSLISTIRTASQKLLDCDRATVFIIEGKEMVVKAQGMEKEIPGGFRIPIGKGIIGNVAQTGQTENIQDVYEDPRFDPAMDKKTGYRTQTMLCMPVLDTQGKVIAALQMINKKRGYFDDSDEETLVIFSEIISSALQNCTLFMHTITERSRILNILNSIGNYILVFNSEGVMEYSNKSIKPVFGISNKIAYKSQYSSWLRENRQLVLDITSVLQSTKRIQRKSQKIVSATFKRTRTTPNLTRAIKGDTKELHFHYTVAPVQSLSKNESNGVVLILEDVSALAELNLKLEKIQNEVQSMKSSIYGETSLQKCIQKLAIISKSIDDTETRLYLDEIIKTLKQGNLNRADIMNNMPVLQGYSSKAISEYIGLEENFAQQVALKPRQESKGFVEFIESSLMDEIRNVDFDPFAIQDHFTYFKAMFVDFDLINQLDINVKNLMNFMNQVKEHYGLWDNPFHNFYHGFNVLHSVYLLLSTTHASNTFSVHEIFTLMVAGLCHDLEHPGRNNNFEINRGSHLALIYNDKSVLENHHCAVLFKILSNDDSNIISNLTPDLRRSFRKLSIVSILGTDMARHVEIITSLNSRLKDIEENPLKTSDIEGLSMLLLHAADLSHPCKSYDQYSKWSKKVCEEFSLQYQEEVNLGLPPTEIMKDLDKPSVYYANEFGFLKFVIKPLWDCMNLWLSPRINIMIENLEENIEIYQRLKEENPKI
jgi:GAF domain-containing protein